MNYEKTHERAAMLREEWVAARRAHGDTVFDVQVCSQVAQIEDCRVMALVNKIAEQSDDGSMILKLEGVIIYACKDKAKIMMAVRENAIRLWGREWVSEMDDIVTS